MSPVRGGDGDLVRRFLLARAEQGRTPGVAWWVEEAGRVETSGAVGRSALEPPGQPVARGTPFDLASLTKPLVTATLLVLLEQDGTIDLDRPAVQWLPELGRSPYATATPLDLAVHAGGMPAWHPLFVGSRSTEGYLEQIARLSPAAERGHTLYSDLGYIALGAVIERAAAQPLDRLFEQRVARPLRLLRTGFSDGGRRFADAAATECGSQFERRLAGPIGAAFAWRTQIPRGTVHDTNAWALGGVAGHAGLFGPVDEVATIARALLAPSPLGLSARARKRLLAPRAPGAGRTLGFVLAGHAAAARGILPDDAPGHTGFTGTAVWLDPPGERIFVLLTNRIHPSVPIRPFHPVRRGFHRLAIRALAEFSRASGAPRSPGA